MLLSFGLTPLVKRLAYKIGAVDVPKDRRRMHSHPIPRLGGLAIFVGFVITVLLFAQPDRQLRGILLGACLIVAVGVVDDSHPLGAGIKFILQIVAALIAVWHGVVIQMISNPLPFIGGPYWDFGIMAVEAEEHGDPQRQNHGQYACAVKHLIHFPVRPRLSGDKADLLVHLAQHPLRRTPEPYIPKVGARIMSLTNPAAKMSKSENGDTGRVTLMDDPNVIMKQFKRPAPRAGGRGTG